MYYPPGSAKKQKSSNLELLLHYIIRFSSNFDWWGWVI